MKDLEKRFHNDMISIYKRSKAECGYNATRFLQLVSTKGGLLAAKQLIATPGSTDGFGTLKLCNRLDLSVEAHVIKPEYESLFSPEERAKCKALLEELGYIVS